MNGAIKNIALSKDGNIAFDDILRGVSSLETTEIMQFMHEISLIVAQRKATPLSLRESQLLRAINESIPDKLQMQYEALAIKLNEESITEKEHQQLLRIITKLEENKGKKLEYMIELAQLRKITLQELASQLQTKSIFYA
jgi:hypothetical protein